MAAAGVGAMGVAAVTVAEASGEVAGAVTAEAVVAVFVGAAMQEVVTAGVELAAASIAGATLQAIEERLAAVLPGETSVAREPRWHAADKLPDPARRLPAALAMAPIHLWAGMVSLTSVARAPICMA